MNDTTKLGYKKDLSDEEKLALSQAMLDSVVSDIEVLPDFVNPPKGSYFIDSVKGCEAGLKPDGKDVQIKVFFVLGHVIELAQYPGTPAEELPEGSYPPEGSLCGYTYTGALGIQKFLKAFASVIQAINPSMTVRELVENLASGTVTGLSMITSMRANNEKMVPNDKGELVPQQYSELVSVQIS